MHIIKYTVRFLTVRLFFALILINTSFGAHANQSFDGLWTASSEQEISAFESRNLNAEHWVRPNKYKSFTLDHNILAEILEGAPVENLVKNSQLRVLPVLIYLPTPDGEYMAFEFVDSPVMAPELAAKFPSIKSYAGVSVDNKHIKVRFDFTPAGFHAQVLQPGARWYIDPQFKGNTEHYLSYYSKHTQGKRGEKHCTVENSPIRRNSSPLLTQRSGDTLRTYRLAVATTGEYGAFHGGTSASVLAAVVTTINRVTGIYENELSIRLSLVANNDQIIFFDPNTDPFNGNSSAATLINESQTQIDSLIGSANYDVGHTFSTGAGGLAGLGVVCTTGQKASGVTGLSNPTGDPFDVDFVAHELGHQFGGNHTFNGANGNCSGGNRNGSTAYEIGSGSTIQAYAGICGADNLQNNSDAIFHSESHREITTYAAAGGNCSINTATGNNIPAPNAGSDFTIPVNTPFVLTGSATDPDVADVLTYIWEERDLGSQIALSAADNGSSPLFRVYTPSTSPSRFLPKLSTLAANSTVNEEKIPQQARTMTWRFTARDGNGGVESDDTQIIVNTSAGPFTVSSPNGGESLSGSITVNWVVANTNAGAVNTANVDIFLSTDGGLSFDLSSPLVSATPNDGSHTLVLPNITTSQARIMIKGNNNVFFDISNADFSIVPDLCGPGETPPTANAGIDRSIDAGQSTIIGTAPLANHTYNWSPTGATTAQITVSPTVTTTYTITATTSCGQVQDSVTVSINSNPSFGLYEDFEGDTSAWTTTGLWHKTDDSTCSTPGYSTATHAFYYGQDNTCNYNTGSTTSGELVSGIITDIAVDSTLSFDFLRQVEFFAGLAVDAIQVDVIDEDTNVATTVFTRDSTTASSNAWLSSGDISLASFADKSIRLRFRFNSVDSINNSFIGWFIDDVVVTSPNLDSDKDGITDVYEADNGLDPLNPIDATLDPDDDGLSNLEEFIAGTLINNEDTDGDGIKDGSDDAPTVSNNDCNNQLINATLQSHNVNTDITYNCGTSNSIQVQSSFVVNSGGTLRLISPSVEFFPGFILTNGAQLSVTSDP